MQVYDQAHTLAQAVRESAERKEYDRLRELAYADETNAALLKEYKRLQTQLQLAAVSQTGMDQEAMQKFQKLSSLLYMNQDVQNFLMAEMRLQKLLADILKIISDAAGLDLGALGIE